METQDECLIIYGNTTCVCIAWSQ